MITILPYYEHVQGIFEIYIHRFLPRNNTKEWFDDKQEPREVSFDEIIIQKDINDVLPILMQEYIITREKEYLSMVLEKWMEPFAVIEFKEKVKRFQN